MMMSTSNRKLSVLMFPWLAYGHISPFLGLAKKLSDRGFLIHLCSTPINLDSIKDKIPEKYSNSIHLVQLHLPDLPTLPPHYQTTNGLPLHLYSTLNLAIEMGKPTFCNFIKTLNPHLLIYDPLQVWIRGVALSFNIPAVPLVTSSAAVGSYLSHMIRRPEVEYPYSSTLYLRSYEQAGVDAIIDPQIYQDKDFQENVALNVGPQPIMLIVSFSEIEGKYIDYLSELTGCKILPIGSIVQDPINQDGDDDMELIHWLSKKQHSSTVFISFGTEHFLSKEDIKEIAFGLELSKANFIWVLRFPKGDKLCPKEALPQYFLERIGDRGRILEGWAPQAKILNHSSIGGFVSHCGWNSIMESLGFGVPIIAIPMKSDQPLNARLMVEIGVAVEVIRDESGKLHREEVARVVKEVIGGKTGEILKRNVKNVSETLRFKGGAQIDAAVEELAQLCEGIWQV